MISRVQGKTLTSEVALKKKPRLSGLEKAMLKWAVVDPGDRLLDANIGSGMMAEYLRRNMQCEVCGVSDNMESVRAARSRLQNSDIVYAVPGDIPWREEVFDTVLMKLDGQEEETLHRMISEASRVLRPGGQLILGTSCYPAVIQAVVGLFAEECVEEKHPFQRAVANEMLYSCEFENITWQRTGIGTGVMIAWKSKACVSEMRSAC